MTTGALIFAFNNAELDYLAMAEWSANNIKRHLNIPVAVVTDLDKAKSMSSFDRVVFAKTDSSGHRYFDDIGTAVPWFNSNRADAYSLSPWDKTLVLDADYVVASNQLKPLLHANEDFLCHRYAYDLTGTQDFNDLNHFGRHQMPMWWATVMMFNRSDHSRLIFETMSMVRHNWQHYKDIYGTGRSVYRNDHALSIALCLLNGHTIEFPSIPWSLASVTHSHKLSQISVDRYRIDFVNQEQKPRWIEIANADFHAMGKGHLGEIIANSK